MNEQISFYELARTSHIKRWTIINTTKEQNLAEHQYNVTVIGLELAQRASAHIDQQFILTLMFHDSPEIRYGDVPTPGKAYIRRFQDPDDPVDIFHQMDSVIMEKLPYYWGFRGCPTLNDTIIKLADLIEAAWWIGENGVGHHAKIVADKCWRAVVDFVHDNEAYHYANPVLADLGLPHISKSERITPP